MATQKYFGRWQNYDSMIRSFRDYDEKPEQLKTPVPAPKEVLFASYGGGSYEGNAVVIFNHNGKLYEVQGSHCSCYRLEGQWEPNEVLIEQLAARSKKSKADNYYYFLHDHDAEAVDAYWYMVDALSA